MADKKPTNRERVSSRTQHSGTILLHEIFQDIADVYSGKFNRPKPTSDEARDI